jgi:phosphatidylserine/phosphatidylglycerophosphate/cardiolipin synthase-like enzyme
MPRLQNALLIPLVLLVVSCAGSGDRQGDNNYNETLQLLDTAGVNAGNEEYIRLLHASRSWESYDKLAEDPIELGKNAKIEVQHEGAKILGHSEDDALRSLALKIWMIEHAEHTLDVVYYIFSTDLVGSAILGALCNAVKRGVDVRIMVDSIGSLSLFHNDLRALETCAQEAGYMRTVDGKKTPYKARVQAVIFNALTSSTSWINRRSHDKLLVMDGAFPSKAAVITGGRNISLAYYGINKDGSNDPHVYHDLEIVLKPSPDDTFAEPTVGDSSTIYYTLLFLHNGNRLLHPVYQDEADEYSYDIYAHDPYSSKREMAQQSLEHLKSLPEINKRLNDMTAYMNSGFQDSDVRLAHELGNLTNLNSVTNTQNNLQDNPNSITYLLKQFSDEVTAGGSIRIVSPYLFIVRYVDKEGNVIDDGVANIHLWLSEDPQHRIEIITNSVLTSDNFLAQSVIDMDLGPRLLLTPEMEKIWLSSLEKGEFNPEVVESEQWKKLINNPQIFIYETGRLDSAALGNGSEHYGKLHAKFLMGQKVGFIGTSNFDYRSRLYNNEMGFFFSNEVLQQELNDIFEDLKAISYRWGTPQWLQMRKEVIELGGMKGWSTKQQRSIYKLLKSTGLIWLI